MIIEGKNLGLNCVTALSFAFEIGNERFKTADFDLSRREDAEGGFTISGNRGSFYVEWVFKPYIAGFIVSLGIFAPDLHSVDKVCPLILNYKPDTPLRELRIPNRGLDLYAAGVLFAGDLGNKVSSDSLLRGAFVDAVTPGLFMGTLLPQRFMHTYDVRIEGEGLCFEAHTKPPKSYDAKGKFFSEQVFVTTAYNARDALLAYGGHLNHNKPHVPVYGWNSWDYYFGALKPEDLRENLEEIERNDFLKNNLKYFFIDMGWEHCEGEWVENYRFREGLPAIAREISSHSLTPGIWVAPLRIKPLSYPAMRDADMLLRNGYGDPVTDFEGFYLIDTTTKKGINFVLNIFERLYKAGFRAFKVDFVKDAALMDYYSDSSKGGLEVLRDLFLAIRSVVKDSYIMSGMYAECGFGLLDGIRTGIDIHNQWEHVKWAMEFFQWAFWQQNNLCSVDVDFLVVRGSETSRETETNVLNPNANNPDPPRWRRGPVFNEVEARTWADIVHMSGGNVFLSDRLSMLNDAGLAILRDFFARRLCDITAIPLDLAQGTHPVFWYRVIDGESELTIINWEDNQRELIFDFALYGLPVPTLVKSRKGTLDVQSGCVYVPLLAHQSEVLRFTAKLTIT